ncbi:MAG: FkbM family methyltransferase [Planctomycetes bacterium]|nr:FkbM family methyltransferase [Planctomycetota bacterium]
MKLPFSLIEMLGERVPHVHIVDIGAMYMGDEYVSYRPLLRPGLASVVGFEPLVSECEKLNAAAAPGQRYLPYCIADGSERTFHVTNTGFTSSLYEPNTELLKVFNNLEELTRVIRSERIRTHRLDDLSEVSDVHLLKLDVQGAELDVLRHSERILRSTMLVQCEIEFLEMYKGQPMYSDVDAFMRSRGFMLHFFMGFGGRAYRPVTTNGNVNLPIRHMLWSDAVYVPHVARLHEYPPERLLVLALILHEVYMSVDLAAVVLNHYDRQAKTDLWSEYLRELTGRANPGERPPLLGVDSR